MNIRFISFLILIFLPVLAFGQSISDLEKQKSQKASSLEALEAEVQKFQQELNIVSAEKNTLNNAVKQLDLTDKKLGSDIRATEKKISNTNSKLGNISSSISDKETKIDNAKKAIEEGIRKLNELDQQSSVNIILAGESISDVLNEVNEIIDFHKNLRFHVQNLTGVKTELIIVKTEEEGVKKELVGYKKEVEGEKKLVVSNKNTKNALLTETKNKESEYQKIIQEKLRLKAEFEAELEEIESKIAFILDPDTIPKPKFGFFAWPLDYILITQSYGLTADSKRLYSYRSGALSGKHTGVDFRANGDKVRALANGKVIDFGNTDLTCPRASFGKWMLIDYQNGLSGIFSHLSSFSASKGESVSLGDVVAYSGNTGYSTGPHLDVKIVPTAAVSIQTWPSRGCPGQFYTTPIVAGKTYLDPLGYFPKATADMFK